MLFYLSVVYLVSVHGIGKGPSQQTLKLSKLIEGTYDDIHIVISTGCSGYQNWQSEVLLYSWAKVKQPGRITRLLFNIHCFFFECISNRNDYHYTQSELQQDVKAKRINC